ncbi:MAG: hypothetical protein JOZ69_02405, partial [Myxococcales bacterium]|nr:hypothetical protein [Myxococcales bacterium]
LRTFTAMAAGAALTFFAVLAWQRRTAENDLLNEAVNDHLRVLYKENPLDVENSNQHVVKPWFEGRLDFAPRVIDGGPDFPLQGGAVGYFLDRKAAILVFKRRLHVVTLVEMRADGLPWPLLGGSQAVGAARGDLLASRGFHVLLWREGDLGFALVSDVDPHDLALLGEGIASH